MDDNLQRLLFVENNSLSEIKEIIIKENMEIIFTKLLDIPYYDISSGKLVTSRLLSIHYNGGFVIFNLENSKSVDSSVLYVGTITLILNFLKNEIELINYEKIRQKELVKKPISSTEKLFFLEKNYNLSDDEFAVKALKFGEVKTIKEFIDDFNYYHLTNINVNNKEIRLIKFDDEVVELCQHCGNEVVIKADFKTEQKCPICRHKIKPCSLCDNCEYDCPQNC